MYFFKNTNYFYTLDVEAFADAISKLAETNYIIDESSSDSHITGTISTSKEDQMILTTIPYDAGWIVKVDGKTVETYATLGETLMAFDIDLSGNHTLEMTYMPKIYVISGIISVISLAAFVGFSVFEYKRRKKKSAQNNTLLAKGDE